MNCLSINVRSQFFVLLETLAFWPLFVLFRDFELYLSRSLSADTFNFSYCSYAVEFDWGALYWCKELGLLFYRLKCYATFDIDMIGKQKKLGGRHRKVENMAIDMHKCTIRQKERHVYICEPYSLMSSSLHDFCMPKNTRSTHLDTCWPSSRSYTRSK